MGQFIAPEGNQIVMKKKRKQREKDKAREEIVPATRNKFRKRIQETNNNKMAK